MWNLPAKKKAPYYPQVELEYRLTNFGSLKCNKPDLYKRSIPGYKIVQIDLLQATVPLIGEGPLISREKLYDLVSGDIDDDTFRKLITSYYKKFETFSDYIDSKLLFKDKLQSPTYSIINPLREAIYKFYESCVRNIDVTKGKLVMNSDDYLYVIYKYGTEIDIKTLRGVLIC